MLFTRCHQLRSFTLLMFQGQIIEDLMVKMSHGYNSVAEYVCQAAKLAAILENGGHF